LRKKKQTTHQELQITAITRTNSTASIPGGVRAAPVDYGDHASLVAALAGHDVLIITLAVTAPGDTQEKLVTAAVEAGVEYILPNFWGVDTAE
jgi:saccharopine dehydrogenase-like NADP-dependent oxidoreductase